MVSQTAEPACWGTHRRELQRRLRAELQGTMNTEESEMMGGKEPLRVAKQENICRS